ncbi:hypothetical protein [Sphaerisporangium aureirubrum]|uniref:Uncharacterized protein n=1 Tax=Sphaerisporangium aureirubrum TaxID=1544736 RepID=A0ABW1NPT3_9ACTN
MSTSEHPPPGARLARGRRTPPRWFALLLLPVGAYLAVALTEKHSLAVGVLAAVVYGTLALVPLFSVQVRSWSKAHPVLDSLVLIPLIFLALAYLTPLSLPLCAAITAACTLPWLAITAIIRRRRHSKLLLDRVGGILSDAADTALRRDTPPPTPPTPKNDEPGRPGSAETPPA